VPAYTPSNPTTSPQAGLYDARLIECRISVTTDAVGYMDENNTVPTKVAAE
jgi:hypothetical protein